MGDNYCLIGPYKEQCARTEVEEGPLPVPELEEAVNKLRNKGFKVLNCYITFISIYWQNSRVALK